MVSIWICYLNYTIEVTPKDMTTISTQLNKTQQSAGRMHNSKDVLLNPFQIPKIRGGSDNN